MFAFKILFLNCLIPKGPSMRSEEQSDQGLHCLLLCLHLLETFLYCKVDYEPRHEKINILVHDLVRHKPGCTATEDG